VTVGTGRYRVRSPGPTGKVLRILLLCTGAAALVADVGASAYLSRRSFVLRVPSSGDPYLTEPLAGFGSGWFALLQIPSLLSQATIVVWLIWQHQATANLWARGHTGLRITPGWAVGWWFVPFANLGMPLVAMRELDRRSSADGVPRKASPLLGWWWAAWLTSSLVPVIGIFGAVFPKVVEWAGAIDEHATTVDFTPLTRVVAPWLVATGALQLAAAVLAFLVVKRIDTAQAGMVGASPPLPQRPDLP